MEKLLCPSMMCADYGRLAEEIKALDEAGVDIFHCDIMDSTFVPNITMGLMDLKTIRKYTKKPVDVHLMIENPGEKVDWFLDAGADIVYIHPESERYVVKTLAHIKSRGAAAGIAINPDTSLATVEEMLNLCDYVMVMTVNPGFAGQKFIQDEVDYLLISAAGTSGWDSVLQDAQAAGIQVILFDRTIDADESLYVASIVSDMAKEGQTAVDWLASQNLETYNIIHIQGVMGSAAQIGRTGALDEQVAANDNWNMVTQQTAEWNAETAQQIVQSVIDSGKEFNVIYAENDDMAKGAVAALDKANISHGVGKDVIVMGFDCNKWALEELLAGNWNYDGQCNPFQASYIDAIIKDLQAGKAPAEKTIIMDEKGFDASTITQEDVDNYGI